MVSVVQKVNNLALHSKIILKSLENSHLDYNSLARNAVNDLIDEATRTAISNLDSDCLKAQTEMKDIKNALEQSQEYIIHQNDEISHLTDLTNNLTIDNTNISSEHKKTLNDLNAQLQKEIDANLVAVKEMDELKRECQKQIDELKLECQQQIDELKLVISEYQSKLLKQDIDIAKLRNNKCLIQ